MSAAHETTATVAVSVPKFVYFTKSVHHETYDRISPLRPELSANGKNIVVTGGGTGIGKAIAISFAQAGAKSVSILGRREGRLRAAVVDIQAAATNATSTFSYEVADLLERDTVDKAFRSIVGKVGTIEILVSNAAALPAVAPLADYDTAGLLRGFSMNVLSAFNAVQAFIRPGVAAPSAMIINISSAAAHIAPAAGLGGYAIGKAATVKMMDYFAAENPRLHIVSVQPGTVDTEMSAQVGVKGGDTAELPGNFCVWLACAEASFLKSKYVWANWDVDELVARSREIEHSRLLTFGLEGV